MRVSSFGNLTLYVTYGLHISYHFWKLNFHAFSVSFVSLVESTYVQVLHTTIFEFLLMVLEGSDGSGVERLELRDTQKAFAFDILLHVVVCPSGAN